jgi:predicted N-formylglutamate amidohydrolase
VLAEIEHVDAAFERVLTNGVAHADPEPELATLLAPDEPAPFEVVEDERRSPFFFSCDHAGKRIPRALGTLGLPESELDRHIAWDLGAAQLARCLARELGAFAILQTYSRLVIDCNRQLDVPSSIPVISESTVIPGNQSLSAADAAQRARAIFHPYHARILSELERRERVGQASIFVAVHSFTPTFKGVSRPWHTGMLYNRDVRLGRGLLQLLREDPELVVGDNEPYAVSDLSDYGVVVYGERRGIPHVEIEIRQDLLADEAGWLAWGRRFARLLPEACAKFAII